METDDERFDRRRGAKTHGLGYLEDAGGSRLDHFGITAVRFAETDQSHRCTVHTDARTAAGTFAARQIGHHHNPVTGFEARDARADLIDDACQFVAHDGSW